MMKKIIALLLCLITVLTVFTGCSSKPEDVGGEMHMYIADPVYNFDPARAYGNESALKVISLLFDNLFYLNKNGKVKMSLAEKYEIIEDEKLGEYKMVITLKKSAWSNGFALTADDVVYAWKRILDPSNSFEAASLLYDIKYAKEAKNGERSIDDVLIYALNESQLEICFDGKIDYDRFLLNLTSYALAPVKESIVNSVENEYDWAKKTTIIATSGPFMIDEVIYTGENAKLVLERNPNYLRNVDKDAFDKYVKPYKLIIDYSKTDAEIKQGVEDGSILYIGDIPLSIRKDLESNKRLKRTDALSTHTYMLNQNAVVRYYNEQGFEKLSTVPKSDANLVEGKDGDKIFANKTVRQVLSLALNRTAIADSVTFAKPATGIVSYGIFDVKKNKSFREEGGDILATNASSVDQLKQTLNSAGIDPSKYMFAISVAAYDDVHMEIAKQVQAAWSALGFHVAIQAIDIVENDHKDKNTDEKISNVMDDLFSERYLQGKFEVAAIDYVAYSADAFSVLAPFAYGYTGGSATNADPFNFEVPYHITGYNNEAYNEKIIAAQNAEDNKTRLAILHEAEKILMDDMATIPVVFNENATITSKELRAAKVSYYGTPIFTKLAFKNVGLIILSIVVILVAALGLGLIPALIAKKAGRRFIIWWGYGSLLFIVATVHIFVLKIIAKIKAKKAEKVAE